MGTERHKFDDTCGHHIANEVTADINVTGELATASEVERDTQS
jgi:hypothetical protein